MNAYDEILHENRVVGADIEGFYDFPVLPKNQIYLNETEAVGFSEAKYEKNPRKKVCHFFQEERFQEMFWNNPQKYLGILRNFKWVCTPDFSVFSDMPKSLQIYNSWRNRASAFFLAQNGVNIIPTVEWGGEDTWDFCFDGLPTRSTLAFSTNGANDALSVEQAKEAYNEMKRRLEPKRLVIVGHKIDFDFADIDDVFWLETRTMKVRNQ